eukprot:3929364-Rhodomonas_salina.1
MTLFTNMTLVSRASSFGVCPLTRQRQTPHVSIGSRPCRRGVFWWHRPTHSQHNHGESRDVTVACRRAL